MAVETATCSSTSGKPTAPAILLADSQGRCTHVNQRWKEIAGFEFAVDSAEGWMDLAHPDDRQRLRDAWNRCVCSHGDFTLRVKPRAADGGKPGLLELRATPMPAAEGEVAGFVVILEEVAQAERNEAEVLHARKMEAVGRLASGLAHDFANLLTMISGYSEIVMGRVGANDVLRAEVDEIRKAASRGSALTGQLLAFSRRHTVEPQLLDLNALVTNMQKMLRRMIGEHIELSTQLSPELEQVEADPGQIEQVIMNLAINARDAMPRGGKITIRTANVELGAQNERANPGLAPGPYVMLQFNDTGDGMDAETMQHLFEPFFTTKEKGKGTGLGLATVYGIIKQSRGGVTVQSEHGNGTSFSIYFPRAEAHSRPSAPETEVRPVAAGTETILLVEDEDGVRRLLQHVLSHRGYTVLEARNGPEAVALYQQLRRPVHLLLTDVVMPRMTGRELADRLLKLQPDLKVIYMSGYTDEVLIGAGRHPGALFLQKPLRPDVLVARIRELLDGATKREERAATCVQSGG